MRFLCVHGVGDHHTDLTWQKRWEAAITRGISAWSGVELAFDYYVYDEAFDQHDITFLGSLEAAAKR